MTMVVPRFEKIFTTVLKGAPLPALTSGVLGASRFVQAHWLVLLGWRCWPRRAGDGCGAPPAGRGFLTG